MKLRILRCFRQCSLALGASTNGFRAASLSGLTHAVFKCSLALGVSTNALECSLALGACTNGSECSLALGVSTSGLGAASPSGLAPVSSQTAQTQNAKEAWPDSGRDILEQLTERQHVEMQLVVPPLA